MVALVHSGQVAVVRSNREPHLDHASLEGTAGVEADLCEYGEHGSVLAHDLCDECLDPVSCCSPGELLDEPDADAPALIVVRHHKRRLGNERVPQSNVVRDRDHPFVADLPDNGDERASFGPIGSDKAAHEAIAAPTETVEAEVAASLREPGEEP